MIWFSELVLWRPGNFGSLFTFLIRPLDRLRPHVVKMTGNKLDRMTLGSSEVWEYYAVVFLLSSFFDSLYTLFRLTFFSFHFGEDVDVISRGRECKCNRCYPLDLKYHHLLLDCTIQSFDSLAITEKLRLFEESLDACGVPFAEAMIGEV